MNREAAQQSFRWHEFVWRYRHCMLVHTQSTEQISTTQHHCINIQRLLVTGNQAVTVYIVAGNQDHSVDEGKEVYPYYQDHTAIKVKPYCGIFIPPYAVYSITIQTELDDDQEQYTPQYSSDSSAKEHTSKASCVYELGFEYGDMDSLCQLPLLPYGIPIRLHTGNEQKSANNIHHALQQLQQDDTAARTDNMGMAYQQWTDEWDSLHQMSRNLIVQQCMLPILLHHVMTKKQNEHARATVHLHTLSALITESFLLPSQQRGQLYEEQPDEAVQRTIDYMRQHYREPITVEMLLEMSGLGRWQYGQIFIRLCGCRPLDYLNQLRMERAKELLVLSHDSLREIAKAVGFKDEYYFSRRFRQLMGMPPRQYMNQRKPPDVEEKADSDGTDSILIVPRTSTDKRYSARNTSHQPASQLSTHLSGGHQMPHHPLRIVVTGSGLGDLLWLGVEPIGASLEVVGTQVIYSERLKHITDVGMYGEPDTIAALRPDLIIHEYRDRELSRQLSEIAPVYLTYRYDPAHVRLRQIAGLTGKKREAEQWIEQHQQQSRRLWKQLKQQHGLTSDDHLLTGLVLIHIQQQLYVMGAHGVGLTIYQPFALRPPQAVSNMIVKGIPYELFQPEQLQQYWSDWVVLLIEPEEAARHEVMQLIQSAHWREVQKEHPFQIYLMDSRLNFDDVLTREALLRELPTALSPASAITFTL